MSPRQVRCIFCDLRGPQAIEDIIPDWVVREVGGTPPFSTDFFDDVQGADPRSRSLASLGLTQLKLRKVCATCNNGWMSRIENWTNPLLIRMIRGESIVLSPSQRRLIAAWCQLKCISVDALYGGRYEGIRYLPAEVARSFGQHEQPLLNSIVRVGRFERPPQGVMLRWGRHMGNVALTKEHPPMNLVTVTLAIGFLMAQVVIGAWVPDSPTPNAVFPPCPDWAVICWPVEYAAGHSWPPPTSITPDRFDDLASNGTNAHRFLPTGS